MEGLPFFLKFCCGFATAEQFELKLPRLCVMSSGVPYVYRLAVAFLVPAVCACYVSVVVRRLHPGWPRLLACLPVFTFNFCAPSIFDEQTQLISNLLLNLCFVWLCNFKVFALCLDRGALSRRLTPLQFYTIYVAPVTPRDEVIDSKSEAIKRVKSAGTLGDHGGGAKELVLRFFAKTVVLVASVFVLSDYADKIPRFALEYLYAVALYAFLGFVMDGPASVITSMIGLQIAPHFNKPFLAESLTSFWGKRWNLTISNCLRGPVYDPIYEGQWVKTANSHQGGSLKRRFVGMSACFVVSGLMHELIYWYMMGVHTRNWQWLTFFSIQVPLMALEAVGKKLMKRYRLRLPRWISVVMTMTVLLWLADAFFFPPCLETGLADRVLYAIKDNISQLASFVLRSR